MAIVQWMAPTEFLLLLKVEWTEDLAPEAWPPHMDAIAALLDPAVARYVALIGGAQIVERRVWFTSGHAAFRPATYEWRGRIMADPRALQTLLLNTVANADAQARLRGGDAIDAGAVILNMTDAERLRKAIDWAIQGDESFPSELRLAALSTGVQPDEHE